MVVNALFAFWWLTTAPAGVPPSPLVVSSVESYGITVAVDRANYQPGDTVHISGELGNYSGPVVGVQLDYVNVSDPAQSLVFMEQPTTNSTGGFNVDFTLPSESMEGNYTATTAYQDSTVSLAFSVTKTPKISANVFDLSRLATMFLWVGSNVVLVVVGFARSSGRTAPLRGRFALRLQGGPLLQYLKENPGSPLILAFIVSLVAAALIYPSDRVQANDIITYTFILLVVGVVLQAVTLLRSKQEPP